MFVSTPHDPSRRFLPTGRLNLDRPKAREALPPVPLRLLPSPISCSAVDQTGSEEDCVTPRPFQSTDDSGEPLQLPGRQGCSQRVWFIAVRLRWPQTVTDEALDAQLAEMKAALRVPQAEGQLRVVDADASVLLGEYVDMHNEAHARHRDRLAALVYEAPRWIIDTLGERPTKTDSRAAWDAIVDRELRYRTDDGISTRLPTSSAPRHPAVKSCSEWYGL